MTNIKNIGKELLGKSLNSFHKKTGLTQLEKNNEMQDGILNGILSQVDDAYIEKTEQSNVMHLDGSGDGVVVLDSIEGNTMVNLIGDTFGDSGYYTKNNDGSINIIKHDTTLPPFKNENHRNLNLLKPNTKYTLIVNGDYTKVHAILRDYKIEGDTSKEVIEILNSSLSSNKTVFTTYHNKTYIKLISSQGDSASNYPINNLFVSILEGDWTDKELPQYFEGLQSSFEEKVNEEGKYEVDVVSSNGNLLDGYKMAKSIAKIPSSELDETNKTIKFLDSSVRNYCIDSIQYEYGSYTFIFKGFKTISDLSSNLCVVYTDGSVDAFPKFEDGYIKFTSNPNKTVAYLKGYWHAGYTYLYYDECYILKGSHKTYNPKSNKIKLLINEPLRGTDDVKDRLCVKDGKLMIERKFYQILLNGTETVSTHRNLTNTISYRIENILLNISDEVVACDNFRVENFNTLYSHDVSCIATNSDNSYIYIRTPIKDGINAFKQWLNSNNTKVVIQRSEPIYEEVLNEYGEPIILEGYENGTLYIDSTIVPTTTVRYTPKMESLKTLKQVSDNNIMLTDDINDTIIPYMMEVDLMIMEKEMSLFNSLNKNIRKMEVLDMTNMQKRTGEMLERLIKGKTLNEQECKTRVTVYLNANKITDEQAEELNFLIDEIYA